MVAREGRLVPESGRHGHCPLCVHGGQRSRTARWSGRSATDSASFLQLQVVWFWVRPDDRSDSSPSLESATRTAPVESAVRQNRTELGRHRMQTGVLNLDLSKLSGLLRAEPEYLRSWVEHGDRERLALCLGIIVSGAGLYGAAIGYWRAPLGAFYVGLKLPLIILLTTVGNSLLNAMLAPLLGLNLGFRQSFLAILMSFTIASAILGAFSPIAA